MEDAIFLSTSLRRSAMEPIESVFFVLAFALRLFASVNTCEAQMQAQENEHFSISCIGAWVCVCICVELVHTCISLLLHLCRSCEPGFTPR